MMVLLTPAQLAWAHFRKAIGVGFLLLPLCGALVGAAESWLGQSGYPAPDTLTLGVRAMDSLVNGVVWLMGSAIWGSIFLGGPAVLFGLLRQPLMRLLFAACRSLTPRVACAVALAGTFAIFEIPVWLLVAMTTYGQIYGYSLALFCFGVSLPWLVGALWATWSLLREPV